MFNKLAKVLATDLLITPPLMAEVVFPVDYPFNPTAGKNPFYYHLGKKAHKKIHQDNKKTIYNLIRKCDKWAQVDKALAQQVSHDLERIDEIYENKMIIGSIIGRPVYKLDKVLANCPSSIYGGIQCTGTTSIKFLLPDKITHEFYTPHFPGSSLVKILNARFEQMYNIKIYLYDNMVKDICYLAKEQGVRMDEIQENKTAFTLAMAHLSCQAIDACIQVLEAKHLKYSVLSECLDIGTKRSIAEAIPLKPYDPTQMNGVRFIKSTTSKK